VPQIPFVIVPLLHFFLLFDCTVFVPNKREVAYGDMEGHAGTNGGGFGGWGVGSLFHIRLMGRVLDMGNPNRIKGLGMVWNWLPD